MVADGLSATGNELVIEGQKKALELAVHGAPLHAVLEVIVQAVESQSTQEVLGSILLLSDDGKHLVHGAAPSLPQAYNDAINGIAVGPAVGSCGTAAFTGKTVVVTDIQSDPLWAAFKGLAGEHQLRACWSTPVFATDGSVLATFALYHRTVTEPTARDREVVELLGHTAALVIERDRNARRLRDANERQLARMASMFASAPAAIAVLRGPEMTFDVANPRYLELIGGRQVIGLPLRKALPELEGQGLIEILEEVRSTGKPYVGNSLAVRLARGPGGALEQCYFDFVYQPIAGSDGKTTDILVVAFEVTDLVNARLRAEASEHELKAFVDNLPELAWTARPDGHVEFYNRRWYEYTGTTFEEMQGWGWEKVHDPALLPLVAERWKHCLDSGEPFEMEFTLRGADGIRRWFLTRVAPMRDASGRITRWIGTNANIDDVRASRALAEAMTEQSRDTQQALLELRLAKERAEQRVAELEAANGGGTKA